jgi:hypothetical protein
MSKKNLIAILIIVIVLAIIVIVMLKLGKREPEPQPLSQSDIGLNQALISDSTKSINENINNINVDDVVGTDDLNTIDQELNKL